ncbi:LacI family DNA-binding transcriptional regulator [Lactiplantibacillus daoliensis]|nr:LacI family DNA-binding transcriptional regulator [Lactiplantibacillus daoliensis]
MATIFDIAHLAQTSKSTVSRVVSGNGYVSAETRKRILAAMTELHYVPSQIARQMRSQRTQTIGFLMSGYTPVAGDYVNYFSKIAQTYQYRVNIYQTPTAADELNALNQLMTHEWDAAFILTRRNSWEKLVPYAQFGPLATWQRLDSDQIYSSYVDHYPLYQKILAYLAAQGITEIGHVFNSATAVNTQARLRAIKVFQLNHPTIDQRWQLFYPTQEHAGADAAEKWLALPHPPRAVVVYADYVAAEFMATLRAHGKSVPADCRVFGFDNSEFGRLMDLTTVDAQLKVQAENAFRYLYNQSHQANLAFEKLHPRLVFRSTC